MADTQQPEIIEPSVLDHKPRRKLSLKPSDIIAIVVVAAVIVSLSFFIISRLGLKHEVNEAKIVSDKVISALAKQDTATIRATGDKQFQSKNTADSLNTALTFHPDGGGSISFAEMYGDSKPILERQAVANNERGQHVLFVYQYTKLKVPFYVRIDVIKAPNDKTWHLQALSASSDESSVLSQ